MGKANTGRDTGKNQINGIMCDIKNCIYNDGKTHCTANCISLGPQNATDSSDLVCATFRDKNDSKRCQKGVR